MQGSIRVLVTMALTKDRLPSKMVLLGRAEVSDNTIETGEIGVKCLGYRARAGSHLLPVVIKIQCVFGMEEKVHNFFFVVLRENSGECCLLFNEIPCNHTRFGNSAKHNEEQVGRTLSRILISQSSEKRKHMGVCVIIEVIPMKEVGECVVEFRLIDQSGY